MFGRLPAIDSRDSGFPMRAAITEETPKFPYRYYRTGPILDQGNDPHCVGYSWRQWLTSELIRTTTGPDGRTIYRRAQQIDEWPGENYDGTSVRAGVKMLQELGHIQEYRWASSVSDIIDWILGDKGTIVLGTWWYSGMNTPDSSGFIHPTGSVVGGHAYLLVGWNRSRNVGRIVNSWGSDWGQDGRAWIHGDDLSALLENEGEACAATERVIND